MLSWANVQEEINAKKSKIRAVFIRLIIMIYKIKNIMEYRLLKL